MKKTATRVVFNARRADGPLYFLTYDHAVGYPNIQDEARKTMDLLDKNPEWKTGGQIEGWTWDWLAKNDPAFVKEARGWIRRYKGRWLPAGGSYGQPYFTFISEESGIRQMFYGTRAIRQHLGYDNDIYIYSEHETMPQLPQILAGMGYRGAFFRTHMQYGGDGPARDADWVLWTGLDGSTIPAIPAYSGVEQCNANMWLMTGYGNHVSWANMDAFKLEMRSRGVRYPIISRCDDWGTRPNAALLRDIKAHAESAKWVTAPEYFDLVEGSGIKPPVFQAGPNDFFPEQPWGYCGNRTWTVPRVAASSALTAEALASTAILSGFKWTKDHQARLDDAWKNLLIGEHHDSMIVAIYNEARDFTDPSQKMSGEIAKEAAEFIAARTRVCGDAVFVFNPTAHPRTEAVFLEGAGSLLVVGPDGEAVPVQAGPGGACFVARDVPALGYKVYGLKKAEPVAVGGTTGGDVRAFETGRYQVAFGADGGLVKLRDKLSGRDIIREGVGTGVLEGMIGSRMERSHGDALLTYTGPDVWRVVQAGKIGTIAFEMVYTFVADNRRIDLDIRLDVPPGTRIGSADPNDKDARRRGGQGDNAAKLRYVFNAQLSETAAPAGSPPTRFSGPRGVRHQPLIIQTAPPGDETLDANLWASVETDRSGLAIANCGSMGYRAVGSSIEPILAYSGEYVWGGQKFMEGVYTYNYSLIPYGGYSLWSYGPYHNFGGMGERGSAHRRAVDRDRPLYVLRFTGRGGKQPLQGSGVNLPKTDEAVTALALFPQDGRLFLRLCNMCEKPVSVTPDVPVREVNLALAGRKAAAMPLLLHPWRAQTYEIIRERKR